MRLLPLLCLLLWTSPGVAKQCRLHPLALHYSPSIPLEAATVYASAAEAEGNHEYSILRGQVSLRQGSKRFQTEELHYESAAQQAFAPRGIFSHPQLVAAGEKLHFDGRAQHLQFEKAQYYLPRQQSGGRAERGELRPEQQHLYNVSWTSCNGEEPLWQLRAESLHFDQKNERATAKNVQFRLGSVPLLYLPYFSYPLGEARQSGLLQPELFSSDAMGVALRQPYYWNIAPNRDATFAAQWMSKKGLLLAAEYRHLDGQQSALLDVARTLNAQREGHVFAEHHYQRGRFRSDLLWQQVSHPSYREDFRPEKLQADGWFMERHARIHWDEAWRLRLQDYQAAQPGIRFDLPRRLPELRHHNQGQWRGWQWQSMAEWTRFQQRGAPDAQRWRGQLRLAHPWESASFFLRPQLQWDAYFLRMENGQTYRDLRPGFALDAGLNFVRRSADGQQWLQPRFYYQQRQAKNQSAWPMFDSVARTPQWNDFFQENAFSGGDRQPANRRLVLALEQRWLNLQAEEWARLRLLYQRSWRGEEALSSHGRGSTWALEAQWRPHARWQSQYFFSQNMQRKNSRHQRWHLQYRAGAGQTLSLAYLEHPAAPKLLSGSASWRWNGDWFFFSRHDYDLRGKRFVQHRLGIERQDCCLSWRLAAQRQRDGLRPERWRNALYLEFEFKGLGSVGRSSRAMLHRDEDGAWPPQ